MSTFMRLTLSIAIVCASFASSMTPAIQTANPPARPSTEKILKQSAGSPAQTKASSRASRSPCRSIISTRSIRAPFK